LFNAFDAFAGAFELLRLQSSHAVAAESLEDQTLEQTPCRLCRRMVGSHAVGKAPYCSIQGCTRCREIVAFDLYSSEHEERLAKISALLRIDSGALGQLDSLDRKGFRLPGRAGPQLQSCRGQHGRTQVERPIARRITQILQQLSDLRSRLNRLATRG